MSRRVRRSSSSASSWRIASGWRAASAAWRARVYPAIPRRALRLGGFAAAMLCAMLVNGRSECKAGRVLACWWHKAGYGTVRKGAGIRAVQRWALRAKWAAGARRRLICSRSASRNFCRRGNSSKNQDLIQRPRHTDTVVADPIAGAANQPRAPGRRSSPMLNQEPPRSTRRPQSPSQQSSVHSHRLPRRGA